MIWLVWGLAGYLVAAALFYCFELAVFFLTDGEGFSHRPDRWFVLMWFGLYAVAWFPIVVLMVYVFFFHRPLDRDHKIPGWGHPRDIRAALEMAEAEADARLMEEAKR